ncbi:L-threonylcarbamoyladenylate synthase [Paenibacillus senegalensis]|uniref:L-threonylcarbamoyladenylate synthase n=1 Tax=Paenibacillus senegalensis TaxID=1465766 RepID=UPI000289E4B6|nr:L-threonylcarbamoyladenylate synthase [Paenibacillus senegalensis]
MKTELWSVPPHPRPDDPGIAAAARMLRAGGRVAFPTETVYGLGADARSAEAVQGIFTAKGRPADNPLIVHIADRSQLNGLVDRLDETSRRLMDAFWPGPLTLVLPAVPGAVSAKVTAGLATVAVRMPDHPVALSLIQAAQCPVAAPSANRSGRPSPTQASHVMEDLDGLIDGLIDAGETGVGVESTVVEVIDGVIHVLRPGGVTAEQLQEVAPVANSAEDKHQPTAADAKGASSESGQAPKSPGTKYTHYAPIGEMIIVSGEENRRTAWIQAALQEARLQGRRTGVLTFEARREQFAADWIETIGRNPEDSEAAARLLYRALRRMDEQQVALILAEAVEPAGLGEAVMNRMIKAAGQRFINLQ